MQTTKTIGNSIRLPQQSLSALAVDAACMISRSSRTFGESVRAAARRTAGAAVLTVSSFVGGTGMVGPTAETAEGGIVLSMEYDPAARERGAQRAGLYQGNGQGGALSLHVEYDGDNGQRVSSFTGSAIAFNRHGALGSIHQIDQYLDRNPNFYVQTGPNYMTDPGDRYDIGSVILPDSYTGQTSFGDIPDLAIFRYSMPAPQSAAMTFANARPAFYEELNWAGTGLPGSPATGFLDPDGGTRAGSTFFVTSPPLEGEDDSLYSRTRMRYRFPDELRVAPGDSGSPLWNSNGELLGMYVRGGLDASSGYGLYLDFQENPGLQTYITGNLTAVPEPSSFVLMGGVAAAAGLLRWRRNRNTEKRK